jgi:MarR family transcriptional regulator for hemolysin
MKRPSRTRPQPREFGALLAETARVWRQRLDERLRPLGLSQAKWVALYRLARMAEAPTQAALAAELGVEAPTVARLLSRLEAAGYVERRPAAGDRRLKVVHLTARARAEAARIDRVAADLRGELMAGLDSTEFEAAFRILLEVRRRLGPVAAAAPAARRDRR